jgi:hypothetical protein
MGWFIIVLLVVGVMVLAAYLGVDLDWTDIFP